MSFIRVKMGMVEYSFEYETLEDIINHFKENGCSYIELTTFDNYDSWHSKKNNPYI
jgi:sugar phosphate isomerase/epimerase